MPNRILEADFTLVICTAQYSEHFLGQGTGSIGKGTDFEGAIITEALYEARGRNLRFIPVVFCDEDIAHIPVILKATNRYNLSREEDWRRLCQRLASESPKECGSSFTPGANASGGATSRAPASVCDLQKGRLYSFLRSKTSAEALQRLQNDLDHLPSQFPPCVFVPLTPVHDGLFSHLHLFVLGLVAHLLIGGLRVLLYLEDLAFEHLKEARAERGAWPAAPRATAEFEATARYVLGDALKVPDSARSRLRVARESDVRQHLPHATERAAGQLRRHVLLDEGVLSALRVMRRFATAPERVSFERVQDIIEEYIAGVLLYKSSYVMVGPDRSEFYRVLEGIAKTEGIGGAPATLTFDLVPDIQMKTEWMLDSETLMYPFRGDWAEKLGAASNKDFLPWARRSLPHPRTILCEVAEVGDLEGSYVQGLFSSKRGFPRQLGDALDVMAKDGRILSVSLFGSAIERSRHFLNGVNARTGAGVPEALEGDMDLLIVVPEKTSAVCSELIGLLTAWGRVVVHPDMYSPRQTECPTLELIVLPQHSRYLCGAAGTLLGLSLQAPGHMETVAGVAAATVLDLPDAIQSFGERVRALRHARYGIIDMLATLWARMNDRWWEIDPRRILRFGLVDVGWALTGTFEFDVVRASETIERECDGVHVEHKELIEALRCGKLKQMDDRDVMAQTFDLLQSLNMALGTT